MPEIELAAASEGAAARRASPSRSTPAEQSLADEGYALVVVAGWRARHRAHAGGTLLWRVTLWHAHDICTAARRGASIRATQIKDAPRFAWRGLMLDSARHYQSPEYIKQFHRLDGAAQAQRAALASHRRPGLAPRDQEVSEAHVRGRLARASRDRRRASDIDPNTGKPRLYRRLLHAGAGARHRGVRRRAPRHAWFPKSRCPDMPPPPWSPIRSWVCRPRQQAEGRARRLGHLRDICSTSRSRRSPSSRTCMTEVIGLFPDEYIHVGGDEAVKDAVGEVRARSRRA